MSSHDLDVKNAGGDQIEVGGVIYETKGPDRTSVKKASHARWLRRNTVFGQIFRRNPSKEPSSHLSQSLGEPSGLRVRCGKCICSVFPLINSAIYAIKGQRDQRNDLVTPNVCV